MDDFITFPQTGNIEVKMGNCLDYLKEFKEQNIQFDAIITDPPYEISLHGINWDQTNIAFSNELWSLFFDILKPGAFIMAFAAMRLYHKLATVAEEVGFIPYPFLTWQFDGGLPKPTNLSELFDRDNIENRQPIGYRTGSGYTKANVDHGAQNRSKTQFPIYERYVSEESKKYRGYYYGVNCFKPVMEPIFLGQKPIAHKRMIDNVREFGTGALNLGILEERYGNWSTTVLKHKKSKKSDHGSNHPSVKPVSLMEDLCLLGCPIGGKILDPFAGTGTTGVAAKNHGLDCVLIECNPAMEEVIRRRLS